MRKLTHSENAWIETTLAGMSLREKIGQTAVEHACRLPLEDFSPETVAAYLAECPVGSIFLAGEIIQECGTGTAEAYHEVISAFQQGSAIPVLVAGDLEHGAGSAVPQLTRFPDMMALGAANSTAMAREFGRWTAEEGCAVGFNWTFSPVTDLLQNWLNPIVSNRSLGSDPERVGRLACAIVEGMQSHGLAACAKHFPGDGADFRDQHLCTSVNNLPEAQWWATFGKVFLQTIEAGVDTIMAGHIALPWAETAPDAEKPRPATVSRAVLTDLLRGRMGFEGVVVSDALDMAGYTCWDGYEARTVDCFNAGVDAMLWPGAGYFDVMLRALADGRISVARLDESVRRILALKVRRGVVVPEKPGYQPVEVALRPAPEAAQLAGDIAAAAVTLVRNRRGLLPLNPGTTRRVLVGHMSRITEGRETSVEPFCQALRDRGVEVTVLMDWDPATILQQVEALGGPWDAFLLPFALRTHGLPNTVRPVGENARAMWCAQMLDGLSPIAISMSTPFLLMDMPWLDTLVNTYAYDGVSVEMCVRALFGEIPFSGQMPVPAGGWQISMYPQE